MAFLNCIFAVMRARIKEWRSRLAAQITAAMPAYLAQGQKPMDDAAVVGMTFLARLEFLAVARGK